MPEFAQDLDLNERRTSRRFPLHLSVKYRVIGALPGLRWKTTESVNISSTGILFATEERVLPGQGIEACVSWPVALDQKIPLKLTLKGPVVRSDGNRTAMRFERYEFKTRSAEVAATISGTV